MSCYSDSISESDLADHQSLFREYFCKSISKATGAFDLLEIKVLD
jgi:hypothetical protein